MLSEGISVIFLILLQFFSDFVLVYEEDIERHSSLQTQKGSVDHKRYKFLESLRKTGLEMEEVGVGREFVILIVTLLIF